MLSFWKSILLFLPSMIIAIIVAIIINYFFASKGFFMWILSIGLFAIIYCLDMWIVGMNSDEKVMIKSIIKKVFKKATIDI